MRDALLVHEANNRFDRNAVAVMIAGGVVGYLPKEVAANYAPVLDAIAAHGWQAQVPVEVSWWEDSTEDISPGVRVRLGPPGWLLPANILPAGDVLLMQWDDPGVHCNDVDDAPVAALASDLGRAYGDFAVYGTVELVTEGKRKPRAAVTVDGHQIGMVTPQSSAHLIPLHATAQRDGAKLVVPVAITYLPGQAQVNVACPRAKDLPADWFNR